MGLLRNPPGEKTRENKVDLPEVGRIQSLLQEWYAESGC